MEAKDLKQLLGVRAKEIILNGLGLNPNKSGFIKCPLHNDHKPSMSWFNDGMMWRCNSCHKHIDIYSYYTDFENISFVQAKDKIMELVGVNDLDKPNRAVKKTYTIPCIRTRELSKEALDIMAVRMLTKETLDAWRVKEATWNGTNVYVYQYYQNDIIKHVSYREIKNHGFKGGCEKNTEPILWGMWHVKNDKPLVITEGQPDAMAIWQSGYKNVVSAPSGANSLTWIETCWEWLKGRDIIVWADNDKPGLEFADNIYRRLSNVKVVTADVLKDANEVLWQQGSKAVLKILEDAINEIPNGMLDMSNIEYDPSAEDGIETGFYDYDSYVRDWKQKQLTVIFGRNGEGKTTFVSQIIAHCLEKGVKTFLYSGEMSEFNIQDWLYKQLVGNKKEYINNVPTKYAPMDIIKSEIIKRIKRWHEGLFYIFDRKEEAIDRDLNLFFIVMESAAKRYGVKLFIIDNLMSKLEEHADSLNSDQANFVQKCKNFAINNKVHIVLVAHPNKEKQEINGTVGNLVKTDISGSNNIPNKADNIISVERVWGENQTCDAIVTSLKDRTVGQRKVMNFFFSQKTLRFYNGSTKEGVKYGWEQIMEREIQATQDLPFG